MKKNMFSNHVSRRDLFLYGGHKGQKNDKSSLQQISSQSQGEFSQCLDGFNSSGGSSELSQGRKMFDSYNTPQNSKDLRSLVKPPCSLQITGRPKFQHQFQDSRHKIKENEERGLIQSLSQSVKDCSEEVQNAMKVIPEVLGGHMQVLGDSMTKIINDSLREQLENTLLTLEDHSGAKQQIGEMKRIIEEKEARITDLQKQLEHHQKAGCQQSVHKITDTIHKTREHVDKQIQKMLDSSQAMAENQQRILEGQESQVTIGNQFHSELRKKLENISSNVVKNISFAEEVKSIRRDLEIQKMEAIEFFHGFLTKHSYEQTRDITRQIESEINRSTNAICNTSNSVANIQRDFLQDTMQLQQEEMKEYIKTQLELRRDRLNQESKEYRLNQESKEYRLNQQSQEFKLNQQSREFALKKPNYTQPYSGSKNRTEVSVEKEGVPFSYDLHHGGNTTENCKSLGDTCSNLKSRKKQKSAQHDFLSPGAYGNQNHSKTFFQKPNPSPVAAILPQPQGRVQPRIVKNVQDHQSESEVYLTRENSDHNRNDNSRNLPTRRSQRIAGLTQESQNCSQNAASQNQYQPEQSSCSSNDSQCEIAPSYAQKTKYDRQHNKSLPVSSRTCSQSLSQHNRHQVHPVQKYGTVMPNAKPPLKKFCKESDVFQFSEENSTFLNTGERKSFANVNKRENQIEDNVDESEESRDSSPSLSITKIMIKRKSRKDSPASSVFSDFRTYSHPKPKHQYTSTPGYQQSESEWKANRGVVLFNRQESYKRKLMHVDDDLLALSHTIQNQLKRRC